MKRTGDLIVSALALIVIAPLLAVLAIWIKFDSDGPIFYRGVRAGRLGRPFRIFKLRTMTVNPNDRGAACTLSGDPRITRAGKFLRSSKLDELPQLINVLKGEMSLVGPRPEVLDEVDRYTLQEKQLLSIRPGITDWASIKFYREGEILQASQDPVQQYRQFIRPEKVRLGLEYVRHHSLLGDAKIVARTIKVLLHA